MRIIAFISVLAISFVFISCGPSQREMAVAKINQGQSLLEQGDTLKAIALFDSVSVLYPKALVQIGVARNINNDLYRQLIERKRKEIEVVDTLIASLERNFETEKTQYDKYSQYIHKSQTFSRSWNRSYLGIHLDERGELFLSSNYTGKEQLNHTGIRVYDGTKKAESATIDLGNSLNHQSEFNNTYWERISYMNGMADSVIKFINSYPNLKLKCVFLGKKQYYIILESTDINAVREAFALSEAIKLRKKLQHELALYNK